MSSKNLGSVPVYQKAQSLYELSSHLVSYISFNKDLVKLYSSTSLRDSIATSILTDAKLIATHITEAISSKSYKDRLQNASFVNIMIRNLNSYCIGLEKDGVKEKEYLQLLRHELKSFRSTFKKWRGSLPNLD
jgi:hypothetical protein